MYLDLVTLTCIWRSSDFYTFCINSPYLLNYKAYNHQIFHSASVWCTHSADTFTGWPWPIFCAPVTLTHFTSTFGISSNTRPTTTKPCIVLLLNVQTRQVLWSGDLDLCLCCSDFDTFYLEVDVSSAITPSTTKPCLVLFLDVLTLQVPWSSDPNLFYVLQWL